MSWRNRLQLDIQHRDPQFRSKFAKLYSLSLLMQSCVIEPDYVPSNEYAHGIVLSSAGEELLSKIQETKNEFPSNLIKTAIFLKFYHHQLLIDLEKTDINVLQQALHADIIGEKIRYPWLFDRTLYDRFFELFPNRTDKLNYEETKLLLQDMPQGVFQLEDMVIGPLGLLESSTFRQLEPSRSAPLWHCSDPSCSALHTTQLATSENITNMVCTLLNGICAKSDGPPSEWNKFHNDCITKPNYYDDMNPQMLPWLLANTFSENEIRIIIATLLTNYSREIRARLPQTKRIHNIFNNPPKKISSALSKSECFQLALLLDDIAVVETIEFLIDTEQIKIPLTEVRRSQFHYKPHSWLNVIWECSRFGLRAIPNKEKFAPLRLKRLVSFLYKDEATDQLSWDLRHMQGETIDEKLDNYLQNNAPENIIKEVILSKRESLIKTFAFLRYGKFDLPEDSRSEFQLVNKILWKVGFDIEVFPSHQQQLWERHAKLLDIARTYTTYDEVVKENIRSVAVNFFVSLEEILDYSLSFATWLLLSDHYAHTRFICDLDKARRFMALKLDGLSTSNGSTDPVSFNPDGRNTLFPLIQGFKLLARLSNDILNSPSNEFVRSSNNFPGFHQKTDIQAFPFEHKILLFDLNPTERVRFIKSLEEITIELDNANVCNLRNRMQHNRKPNEFPTQTEIEHTCSVIATTVSKMEKSGICPLIYFYNGQTIDKYHRTEIRLINYRGAVITYHQPSQYRLVLPVSLEKPVIVVPWLHLPNSSEAYRFQFRENSDYVQIWDGYPRRRIRLPTSEVQH